MEGGVDGGLALPYLHGPEHMLVSTSFLGPGSTCRSPKHFGQTFLEEPRKMQSGLGERLGGPVPR